MSRTETDLPCNHQYLLNSSFFLHLSFIVTGHSKCHLKTWPRDSVWSALARLISDVSVYFFVFFISIMNVFLMELFIQRILAY